MSTHTKPEPTDRLGNPLPSAPSIEDIEHQASRLHVVADAQLSSETINRVSLDDLEQRRLRAISR